MLIGTLWFYVSRSNGCDSGLKWLEKCMNQKLTPEDAWQTCPNGEWMLWLLVKCRLPNTTTTLIVAECLRRSLPSMMRTMGNTKVMELRRDRCCRAIKLGEDFVKTENSSRRMRLHRAISVMSERPNSEVTQTALEQAVRTFLRHVYNNNMVPTEVLGVMNAPGQPLEPLERTSLMELWRMRERRTADIVRAFVPEAYALWLIKRALVE